MDFKKTEKGWSYEGIALIRAREALGLTQEGLALRCIKANGKHWTGRNIGHLEKPGPHYILQEAKEILERALA